MHPTFRQFKIGALDLVYKGSGKVNYFVYMQRAHKIDVTHQEHLKAVDSKTNGIEY